MGFSMRENQRNLNFPLGWDRKVNREWRPAIRTVYPQGLERVYGDPDSVQDSLAQVS